MKCIIARKPHQLEIIDTQKPVISDYQALVKTELVAICNATDLLSVYGPLRCRWQPFLFSPMPDNH